MKFNNKKEEEAYERFLQLEIEADKHNAEMIASMDLSHVNKTKMKQTQAGIKRWTKETSKALKDFKSHLNQKEVLKYNFTSKERVWLMTA